MKISGLVITYNEEKNIRECITSLQKVCEEVVVVDSLSQDKTAQIAEEMGATVIKQSFLGDGPQRNFGLDFCKHNWILNLDADERLDRDAVEAIKSIDLEHTSYEAFELRRKNFYKDRWIKCCGWYPDYIRRLFNKNKTRFSDIAIHTKIETENYKRLNAHIIHYAYNNAGEMIRKIDAYATVFAENSQKRATPAKAFARATYAFIKNYIFQRGFLCGYEGLLISVSNANGVFYKYMKLYEKRLEKARS